MATDIFTPSLYTLPIEVIYRILDILDNKTILFSFGNVCKKFYSIIHTYNQYKLDFKSISKPYFHTICHLIQPENIISLTLSNDNQTPDQIKYFLSYFQFQQFTRLRSLILIQIDENDFQTIFQLENIISSLSFTIQKNLLLKLSTLPLISSIISNKFLRYLNFALSSSQIKDLSWPNQSFLQTLIISNRICFKQFSTILSHSLQLRKLVLQDCTMDESVQFIDSLITYSHLISLTFDDSELDMNECELILSLTPSLEHFHIIGGSNLSDGYRWEKFIEKKLLKLNRFEFAFCGNSDNILDNGMNVEALITCFKTKFWIEIKQWFVVCYYFKNTSNYSLYSLPLCKSNVRFYPKKDKISCSTYKNIDSDKSITDNIHEMQLNLTNLMDINDDEETTTSIYPFFRKLNKLLLCVDDEWPIDSVEHLSTFIDLSCIVELSISIDFRPEVVSYSLVNLIDLFKQTCHLQFLTIDSSTVIGEYVCAIVPDYVKHLQVSIKNIDDMKIIIEKLKYLSSITFEHFNRWKLSSSDFVPWLKENRKKSSCRIDEIYVSIWLDKVSN